MLWIWVGLLVAFVAGSAFVGYKLVKRQKAKQMQRWEVKNEMQLSRELSEDELTAYLESENEKLDRYEVLRPVVDELELVGFWGVEDADAALEILKDCSGFRAGATADSVLFTVNDKDKEMAGRLATAIHKSYRAMLLRDQLMAPPTGFGE